MIDRYKLVSRHNPRVKALSFDSPLSVGNGEFAYTADVTGMQTFYKYQKDNHVPLCTMSQWGWHTAPVSKNKYCYTMEDLEMTEYDYNGRKVTYAAEMKDGNEEVYTWLRRNPHRLNLARIGLVWENDEISPDSISNINQELRLYEGVIASEYMLHDRACKVVTACDYTEDVLAFEIESQALSEGKLKVKIEFPYGSHDITASDWESKDKHVTDVYSKTGTQILLKRAMDKDYYYIAIKSEDEIHVEHSGHCIEISSKFEKLNFTVSFSEVEFKAATKTTKEVYESSRKGWEDFWETGGAVELYKSKDVRGLELERRIVLSQYLLAIQSCGSAPPQETGLTCNSWYGKFHLEMHIWHSGFAPLWNRPNLLEKSLSWYKNNLNKAKDNAARNGFLGAKWPKMIAYDAIDSPSAIATLLIWQQPHIIYMLELVYRSKENQQFLEEYWEIVKETADFMTDFAVYNEITDKYDLVSPIIPAQEEHNPVITKNPAFEVEYWKFALNIALKWADRLGYSADSWKKVSEKMADIPEKDGLYIAHENCHKTFDDFNRDHPSMLGAFGFISSERISATCMQNTLKKVIDCWDFSTMWGWDFALMAMTAVRLGDAETAINILLKETPKNSYVASGNNFQRSRTDLPIYLPGNGSLLLAIALMTAGYKGSKEELPGFPKNGMWEVEFENITNFEF